MLRGLILTTLILSIICDGQAYAQKRPSKAEFMFRYVDQDGDNRLSPSEFQLILNPSAAQANYRAFSETIPNEFHAADVDKDGFVRLDELVAWLNSSN